MLARVNIEVRAVRFSSNVAHAQGAFTRMLSFHRVYSAASKLCLLSESFIRHVRVTCSQASQPNSLTCFLRTVDFLTKLDVAVYSASIAQTIASLWSTRTESGLLLILFRLIALQGLSGPPFEVTIQAQAPLFEDSAVSRLSSFWLNFLASFLRASGLRIAKYWGTPRLLRARTRRREAPHVTDIHYWSDRRRVTASRFGRPATVPHPRPVTWMDLVYPARSNRACSISL